MKYLDAVVRRARLGWMMDGMLEWLTTRSVTALLIGGVLAAELLTALIVSAMSLVFRGRVLAEYIVTGVVTSGAVSLFVVTVVIRLVSRLNEAKQSLGVERSEAHVIASRSRSQGWQEVAREVVHQGRNVLTPLRLSAEGVVEQGVLRKDELLQREGQSLVAGLRTLERMFAALKDLSARRSPAVGRVPIKALLVECAELHRKQLPQIDVTAESDLAVLADPDLLREGMSNLVINAIEAKAQRIHLSALRVADGIYVICEDDGSGIPIEHRGRATHLSFTTTPGGSGFGLHFVGKLALELGGRLEIGSARERGARICLILRDANDPPRR